MEYIDIFAELVATLVDVGVVYTFFLGVFGVKKQQKKDAVMMGTSIYHGGLKSGRKVVAKICLAGLYIILPVVLTGFIHNTIKMNGIIVAAAFLFALDLLDGRMVSKLWLSVWTFFTMTLVDYFNVFLFAGIFHENWKTFVTPATPLRNATILMSRFCMLPLVIGAFKLIRGKIRVVRGLYLSISLCISGYIGALIAMHVGFENSLSDVGECELIAVILILLTFCVANGAVIVALNRYFEFKNENEILNVRISDQRDMLKRVDDIYEETRIIRHDTKHYLALVSNLLDMGDVSEADRVVKTALEKKVSAGNAVRYIGSNLVNAILNEKRKLCETEDIVLDISVLGDISEKYEFDVSVLLANLLDNALEAELKSGGDRIYVNLSAYKGMYYITVQNHIERSVLEENPDLATTKQDRRLHGLGIKSVRKQVESMDGVYRCFEENGRFVTSIALQHTDV